MHWFEPENGLKMFGFGARTLGSYWKMDMTDL